MFFLPISIISARTGILSAFTMVSGIIITHISIISEYVPTGQIVFDQFILVKFAATSVVSVRSANAKLAPFKSTSIKIESDEVVE